MAPIRSSRPGAERLRYRRSLAVGMLVSVALHGLLAVAWRSRPGPGMTGGAPDRAAPRSPDRWERERLRAVALRDPAEDVEIPSPPSPVTAPSPEVSPPRVTGGADLASVELTPWSAGPPGRGGGEPGARAGEPAGGGTRRPPVPRSVLPEWDPPEQVRGTEVVVRVHVDAAGRPTGPVELCPPTPSRDFNRRLREKVRAMEFAPARIDGQPVAGWAELTFLF